MIRDNVPIKYDEIVLLVYTVVVRSFINFLFGRRGKNFSDVFKKRGERRRLSGPSISCAPAFFTHFRSVERGGTEEKKDV